MKSITNHSLQTFQIFLKFPQGSKSVFIKPKETIVVPESAISRQIRIMENRRVIKIKSA